MCSFLAHFPEIKLNTVNRINVSVNPNCVCNHWLLYTLSKKWFLVDCISNGITVKRDDQLLLSTNYIALEVLRPAEKKGNYTDLTDTLLRAFYYISTTDVIPPLNSHIRALGIRSNWHIVWLERIYCISFCEND